MVAPWRGRAVHAAQRREMWRDEAVRKSNYKAFDPPLIVRIVHTHSGAQAAGEVLGWSPTSKRIRLVVRLCGGVDFSGYTGKCLVRGWEQWALPDEYMRAITGDSNWAPSVAPLKRKARRNGKTADSRQLELFK